MERLFDFGIKVTKIYIAITHGYFKEAKVRHTLSRIFGTLGCTGFTINRR